LKCYEAIRGGKPGRVGGGKEGELEVLKASFSVTKGKTCFTRPEEKKGTGRGAGSGKFLRKGINVDCGTKKGQFPIFGGNLRRRRKKNERRRRWKEKRRICGDSVVEKEGIGDSKRAKGTVHVLGRRKH